jgi:hypothetical protein
MGSQHRGGQPGSAAAAVWPLGTWSSSMEASSTDNAEDNMETRLLEIGHCTARMLNAAASSGLQGPTDGAVRRAMAL